MMKETNRFDEWAFFEDENVGALYHECDEENEAYAFKAGNSTCLNCGDPIPVDVQMARLGAQRESILWEEGHEDAPFRVRV